MKSLVLVIAFFIGQSAFAMPTAEGLFRNVSNKEPTGNLIVVTAQVEPMEMPLKENSLISAPLTTEEQVPLMPAYYKWLISLERENHIDVIQVTYNNGDLKDNHVKSTRYLPDLKKIVGSDSSLERSLFYGLLSMFVLNESEIIGGIMSKYAQGYASNKELMSREKLNLYYRYKDYLEKRQDNEALVSPLEPEDVEKVQVVKETMAAPMYRDAGNVKLTRADGELVWKVDLKSVMAYFSNEGHRLKRLEYQSPLGDLKLMADDYVLFNGTHELPKTVIIKDMAQKSWKVRFTGLSHLNNRSTPFTKRAQEYAEHAKKSAPKAPVQPEVMQVAPPFIF